MTGAGGRFSTAFDIRLNRPFSMSTPASMEISKYPGFSLRTISLRHACRGRLAHNNLSTYGGRYGIYQSLRSFGLSAADEVLIPAYHCRAMVLPIEAYGCKAAYYPLDHNLQATVDQVLSRVTERTKVVVLVHYFGIYQRETGSLCDELSRRKIYLLEDCAHVIPFTRHRAGILGDIAIFSPWKYLPILDGGILRYNNQRLPPPSRLRNPPLWLALKNLKNAIERGTRSTAKGILHRFFSAADRPLGRARSALLPVPAGDTSLISVAFRQEYAVYAATVFSRWRICATDFQRIYDKRSSISRRLFTEVYEGGGFPPPPFLCGDPGNCVLGFPVLARDRAAAVSFLRSRSIPHFTFGDARWYAAEPAPDSPEARYSADLIFVPLLQDFAEREIEYLAACVKELLARNL